MNFDNWRDAILGLIIGALTFAFGVLCIVAFFLGWEMFMYFTIAAMGFLYSIAGVVLIVCALTSDK